MRNFEEITPMSADSAEDFFNQGKEKLDHLLLGEDAAKIGLLATMAAGTNIVFFGYPGGGKTTLGIDAYRLLEDVERDQVAIIPSQADLQPMQVIGGEVRTVKRITTNGESYEEETVNTIPALIRPSAVALYADEFNRTNPRAIDAALSVYEDRAVDTTAGRIEMDIRFAAATMNPKEEKHNVFTMDGATASRHAAGVQLGIPNPDRAKRAEVADKLLNKWVARPELVTPVISLKDLDALQATVNRRSNSGLVMPKSLRKSAAEMTFEVQAELEDVGIAEADGRLITHMRKLSRALAILSGEQFVSPANITDAARLILGARVGIRGTGNKKTTVDEMLGRIIEKVPMSAEVSVEEKAKALAEEKTSVEE